MVLPYERGLELGGIWGDRSAIIQSISGQFQQSASDAFRHDHPNRRISTSRVTLCMGKTSKHTVNLGSDKLLFRV